MEATSVLLLFTMFLFDVINMKGTLCSILYFVLAVEDRSTTIAPVHEGYVLQKVYVLLDLIRIKLCDAVSLGLDFLVQEIVFHLSFLKCHL